MKYYFTLVTFLLIGVLQAQTICSGGMAGPYQCNKIDLQSQLTITQLGGTTSTDGNDCWGWTDPLDGKEYAIMGLTSHTAFVDISNPTAPVYLGKLPTATGNSVWRDVKVYNNFAFIVSEASNHGMQIFDLTRLRTITTPQTFTTDAYYTGFGKCHNIAIDEASGYAYAIGTTTFSGGPHIVNIQNPLLPVAAGGYSAQNYTHDAQIVVYNGPDTEHVGKQIFFGANETKAVVLDVTDKNNIILLSTFTYTNANYVHQGWLTANHKYFLLGDETDETAFGFNTKTIIVDMSDLDAPVLKTNYFGTSNAIDHNGYTLGNEFYLASYRAGLRLMDISDIEIGNMTEKAFFDTYPISNSAAYNGAWSVYPYFPSGNIIISDIEKGLFVVKKNAVLSTENFQNEVVLKMYPNPTKNNLNLESTEAINSIEIYSTLGKKVLSKKNLNTTSYNLDVSKLTQGVYFITINKNTNKKLIIE